MVREHKPDMLCLQETKLESIERKLCAGIWSSEDFQWAYKPAEGRSGGLLVVWDASCFEKTGGMQGEHFLRVDGLWSHQKIPVSIVNVYAPCDLARKKALWHQLKTLVNTNSGARWCIAGDFNSVRSSGERKGAASSSRPEDMRCFEEFISNTALIDLPLNGRKYTWYRPD